MVTEYVPNIINKHICLYIPVHLLTNQANAVSPGRADSL